MTSNTVTHNKSTDKINKQKKEEHWMPLCTEHSKSHFSQKKKKRKKETITVTFVIGTRRSLGQGEPFLASKTTFLPTLSLLVLLVEEVQARGVSGFRCPIAWDNICGRETSFC